MKNDDEKTQAGSDCQERLVRLAARLAKRLDKIGEILDDNDLILMSGHSSNTANILQRGSGLVLANLEARGPWAGGDPDYEHDEHGRYFTRDACDYVPIFLANATAQTPPESGTKDYE
jgi:hypothetical protein